jgi:hypothetical protein
MARLGVPQSKDTLLRSLKRCVSSQAGAPAIRIIGVVLPDGAAISHVPPIVASALCIKPRGLLTAAQLEKVDTLKATITEFATMRGLAMRFRGLLRGGTIELLDTWLSDAVSSGIHAMRRFAATLRRDLVAVRNAISEPWSNGQTEGQINRLKTLKRAMYGRAGTELLRARMLPLHAGCDHIN